MRRKLVVGNWKMHGTKAEIRRLIAEVSAGTAELMDRIEIGVCPAHIHVGLVAELIQSSAIVLGAQNVSTEPSGAFTGEVSASMLADYNVSQVIVGHSERRELFGESNSLIAKKFIAAQKSSLIPILCVGETLLQRQQGATAEVVIEQLDAVIEAAGISALENAVIAYEPVWAIGTGQTASPDQAQQVHVLLRTHLAGIDQHVASSIRIIYGGSVKAANAAELFKQADIDGGLVGGASLQAEEFISICKSAD